jgi:flavin reductase
MVAERFARAMNQSATAVTVVTSEGPGGRVGQTVSAMSTVSTDPPMLLVCISDRSPAGQVIRQNGTFRVNVLGIQHDHVSDTFAGRPWHGKGPWDFTCGDWILKPGVDPRLADAVSSFRCTLAQHVPAGTHGIYIGTATEVHSAEGVEPLVYLKRIYRRLLELQPSVFPAYPEARPPYERTRNDA